MLKDKKNILWSQMYVAFMQSRAETEEKSEEVSRE